MSDVGLYVSKPGQSLDPSSDASILFSSDYPTLKIFLEGTTRVFGTGTFQIPHGLNYAPAFLAITTVSNSYFDSSDITITRFVGNVDDTNFYCSYNSAIGTTIRYYIFDTRLEEFATYQSGANFLDSPMESDNYGISITKEGYKVGNPDMRNYILNSSCMNMILYKKHYISSISGSSYNLSLAHNLGYVPFFLLYTYNATVIGGAKSWVSLNNAAYQNSAIADDTNITSTITFSDTTSNKFCLIVFKNRVK